MICSTVVTTTPEERLQAARALLGDAALGQAHEMGGAEAHQGELQARVLDKEDVQELLQAAEN